MKAEEYLRFVGHRVTGDGGGVWWRKAWRMIYSWQCLVSLGSLALGSLALASPPEPAIRVVGQTGNGPTVEGMAPFVVNVDGVDSVLGAGDLLDARFRWDFGDIEGASYQELPGWGGAHLYAEPGQYSLSLTITNADGDTASRTMTVNVLEDLRSRLYVSAEGDDQESGETPETAVRTIGRVQQLLTSQQAVLFRRGDVFDLSQDRLFLEDLEDIVLGAYGEGPRPVLLGRDYDANSQDTLIDLVCHHQGPALDQIVIQHLAFRTPTPASALNEFNHVAIQAHGRDITNLVVRDCFFDDVASCLITGQGDWPLAGDANVMPSGVLIQDNVLEESSRYFTFFSSDNTTLLGNYADRGSHTSFIMRFYADRVFVHQNDWQNSLNDLEEWAIAGGEYCYVAHNRFDGTMRIGYEFPDSTYQWLVLENNLFARDVPNATVFQTIRHFRSSDHISIRNNLFTGPVGHLSFTGEGVTDIRLQYNTGIDPNNQHTFIVMEGPNPTVEGAIRVEGNLWISPNYRPNVNGGSPYVMQFETDELAGFRFRDNLWPMRQEGALGDEIYAGRDISRAEWMGLAEVDGDRFHELTFDDLNPVTYAPMAGSSAEASGRPVAGVEEDYFGEPRPSNQLWTVGAVEVPPSPALPYSQIIAFGDS